MRDFFGIKSIEKTRPSLIMLIYATQYPSNNIFEYINVSWSEVMRYANNNMQILWIIEGPTEDSLLVGMFISKNPLIF